MIFTLLAARVLLAAVFLVAGVAKLLDLPGSRRAMRDFGVPPRLAAPFGLLLPLAELAVAAALLPATTAWWGAVGALTLLLLFVGGIALSLARGRQPDCHCFGQLHSTPAGWTTLARNGLLALVAGTILWGEPARGGLSAVAWLGRLSAAALVTLGLGVSILALIAAQSWLLLHLLRQHGRLLTRLERVEAAGPPADTPAPAPAPPETGLPVGTPAPAFALPGLYGETLTLDALRSPDLPVLLVFTNPGCAPCTALLPELGRWQREGAGRATLAVISQGTAEANRAKSAEHGLRQVLLQQDREVMAVYQVTGTPSAVLVHADGTIGSPLAQGAEEIRALVARTLGAPEEMSEDAIRPTPTPLPLAARPLPNGHGPQSNGHAGSNGQGQGVLLTVAPAAPVAVGDPAPALTLPDLDGRRVALSAFQGQPTLVLFWNPGCGFCNQMLDDLRAWEATPPAGAPQLLVVSTGTVGENRALGLRAPILLDPAGQAMAAFGVGGTPMAVLLDTQGRVVSAPAAGAPAVLALAGAAPAPAPAAPPPSGARRGERAPALRLPDLRGKTRDLAHFRGRRTLVLFWNPGCGFCQRMLDDLKAWEAGAPQEAPRLLVVSTGTLEDNRALGLRAPVLLDPQFSVGPRFGVMGTPSAVLVDAQGVLASDVAVGADAILALAGAPPAPTP